MVTFENRIKRNFTGDETKVSLIHVLGLPNNRNLGIKQGQLEIPGQDVKMIFEPVMKEIIKLVKAQIRATGGISSSFRN